VLLFPLIEPAWKRTAAIAISVALLAFLPRLVESTYVLHVLILILISVITGSAWNVVGGYAGQYSVGHAAYFGVGAYMTLGLMQYRGVSPWWGTFLGAAVALVTALVIGTICFRLRGPYFVLASIAVAEIFRVSALNLNAITNGAEGILATKVPWTSKVPYYYVALALALLVIAVNWIVRRSKPGYYFLAIREDQDAAHSLGINLTAYKNAALAISAVFTSLAGSLYALYVGFIDPTTVLALDLSVQIVMIVIIGGIGTILGPVVGALLLVPLSEALRSNLVTDLLIRAGIVSADSSTGAFLREHLAHAHVLIYGVLVVFVILYMPEGVVGFAKKAARRSTSP
jgi:branched-chain amino acid transport system permease protein